MNQMGWGNVNPRWGNSKWTWVMDFISFIEIVVALPRRF